MVAQQVQGDSINTAVLLAGQVDGPVKTVVDANSAMIFGAVAGLVMGLVMALFKYLISKK